MTIAIDTNILLYANYGTYTGHAAARKFLDELIEESSVICLSWQVYYEYIRIVTHPRIHKTPLTLTAAIDELDLYFSNPKFTILNESKNHGETFAALSKKFRFASGNFIHDCHYATLLYENSIRKIVTADMDFKKFDFLEVINPCE